MNPAVSFADVFHGTPSTGAGSLTSQLTYIERDPFAQADGLIHFLAGGSVTATLPFSYDISDLSCYMILYTTKGSGVISTARKTTALNPDTLLFFSCGQPFRLAAAESVWEFYLAFIDGDSLPVFYRFYQESVAKLYPVAPVSDIPSYIEYLERAVHANLASSVFSVSKRLTDILTEVCVVSANQEHAEEHIPDYLIQMKKMFDEQYSDSYSLTDIETMLGISKYRLCREFSAQFGVSPLHYLNARRIAAAKDLLLSSNLTVHEVGSAVGIDNTNHFINLFKKSTGATPFAFKQAAPASIRELHSPYKPHGLLQ